MQEENIHGSVEAVFSQDPMQNFEDPAERNICDSCQ